MHSSLHIIFFPKQPCEMIKQYYASNFLTKKTCEMCKYYYYPNEEYWYFTKLFFLVKYEFENLENFYKLHYAIFKKTYFNFFEYFWNRFEESH